MYNESDSKIHLDKDYYSDEDLKKFNIDLDDFHKYMIGKTILADGRSYNIDVFYYLKSKNINVSRKQQ